MTDIELNQMHDYEDQCHEEYGEYLDELDREEDERCALRQEEYFNYLITQEDKDDKRITF